MNFRSQEETLILCFPHGQVNVVKGTENMFMGSLELKFL